MFRKPADMGRHGGAGVSNRPSPAVPVCIMAAVLILGAAACNDGAVEVCQECVADVPMTDALCPVSGCATYSSGTGSYLVCFKETNQAQAADECLCKGGKLASAETLAAATYIAYILDDALESHEYEGTEAAWLGGGDGGDEGNFTWIDGSPWAYAGWIAGEPDNGGTGTGQDCIALCSAKAVADGDCPAAGWTDRPCDDIFPAFICEIRP